MGGALAERHPLDDTVGPDEDGDIAVHPHQLRLSIAPNVLSGIEDGKRAGLPSIKDALLAELGLTTEEFVRIGRFPGFSGLRPGVAAYQARPDYADELDRLAGKPARERRLDWQEILSDLAGIDAVGPASA